MAERRGREYADCREKVFLSLQNVADVSEVCWLAFYGFGYVALTVQGSLCLFKDECWQCPRRWKGTVNLEDVSSDILTFLQGVAFAINKVVSEVKGIIMDISIR